MQSMIIYAVAALAEIAGCFAFGVWLRMAKSPLWLIPGCASLIAFAYILTRVDSENAGRAYAAYGGIYISFAVLWFWIAEGVCPGRWNLGGGRFACLALPSSTLSPAGPVVI